MTTSLLPYGLASSRPQPSCLEPLRPVALRPERFTERPESLRALQQVDSVEITSTTRQREGGSQKVFVISVYNKLSRCRRIPIVPSRPLAATTAPSTSTHAPDVQVERTFREICRLRDAVYYAASNDHGIKPCAYCTAIFDFILLRSTTPSTTKQWLQREATTLASLTAFLQQLVEITVQVKSRRQDGPCGCHGQQRIPELVTAFLDLLISETPSP